MGDHIDSLLRGEFHSFISENMFASQEVISTYAFLIIRKIFSENS